MTTWQYRETEGERETGFYLQSAKRRLKDLRDETVTIKIKSSAGIYSFAFNHLAGNNLLLI